MKIVAVETDKDIPKGQAGSVYNRDTGRWERGGKTKLKCSHCKKIARIGHVIFSGIDGNGYWQRKFFYHKECLLDLVNDDRFFDHDDALSAIQDILG